MASRDLSWCGFDFDGPCPELELCSVHVLADQRDRLRDALERIADRPYAEAEDAVDMREIAREALARPENERGKWHEGLNDDDLAVMDMDARPENERG